MKEKKIVGIWNSLTCQTTQSTPYLIFSKQYSGDDQDITESNEVSQSEDSADSNVSLSCNLDYEMYCMLLFKVLMQMNSSDFSFDVAVRAQV